ncbi:hypothetical protein D3273_09915 [Lichenibacterium minor]|uniref:Uncharacterized protein n=1 Tax=Lichenibacterium minor TaxID=2316528 RepID=A0A4Q2UA43_9HYPH|nr:hypothetical protein [Lichenibacterium minor]RYC32041.1 hypothetical protein D3273_09915 [Lichenibacterium minor]
MRVFIAFLLAPAAGAALFTAGAAISDHVNAVPYDRGNIFTFVAPLMVGGYPPAIMLGVPAYFIFKKSRRSKLITSALVGSLVASLPWTFISTIVLIGSGRVSEALGVLWETAIPAFFCGCGAGIVFWLVARPFEAT